MRHDSGLETTEAGRLVPRSELEGRLDPFILKRMDLARGEFVVREVAPRLTWNRLDLAIKLFYLEQTALGRSAFAEELYDAHIHAFSLGSFRESGNDAKVDAASFRSAFGDIVRSMRTEGFDQGRSLIPVASDGSFINGGHRTACAIFLGHRVHVVETGLRPVRYDHRYFLRRGMDEDLLDAAVVKHVERNPYCQVALAWRGSGAAEGIEACLGALVRRKAITLSPQGSANLLALLGTGGEAERRGGAARLVAYVYEAGGTDAEARLRELVGRDPRLIHLPASREESLDLARLLLNERSVRFLNMASPDRFPSTEALARGFRERLEQLGVPRESAMLGPAMLLAAFGLKEAQEADVLSPMGHGTGSIPFRRGGGEIRDILQDPRRHLHYWGLKFPSVRQALEINGERQSAEAAEERRLLRSLLPRAEPRHPARRVLLTARLVSSRLRHSAIRTIAALGLREQARRALGRRG